MIDPQTAALIGRTVAFCVTAGINVYATVAMLGLAVHFGWVDLPPQYHVFGNGWIIAGALVLYVVEFVADKIPWIDSLWDGVHTVIRPLGGALIAVASMNLGQPRLQMLAAIVGAVLAASTHAAKAGTRAVANTSPEPFTNWILSFTEDGIVVGLGLVALTHPVAAGLIAAAGLFAILLGAGWIVRKIRRRFARRTRTP
jgi:hypothetical protein